MTVCVGPRLPESLCWKFPPRNILEDWTRGLSMYSVFIMNLTKIKPVLSVHYASGLLVVLKNKPCGSENHGRHRHHCTIPVPTIAGISLLQNGEQDWCLERNWVPIR